MQSRELALAAARALAEKKGVNVMAVSYTHLDVYKRQEVEEQCQNENLRGKSD